MGERRQQHRKLMQRRKRDPLPLTTRTFAVRAETLNEANRSIEAVIATEAPVQVFDFDSFRMIDEVLRMDGVKLPASGQVPLLDAHSRFETANVLGSTRELRVEGDKLIGRSFFSSLATEQWTKTVEGHLTDHSVGYRVLAGPLIAPGESETVNGKQYTAVERALRVATAWEPKEDSLVPVGADSDAKNRELTGARAPQFEEIDMFEIWLKGRGHDPETLDDKQRADLGIEYEREIRGPRAGPPPDEKQEPGRAAEGSQPKPRTEPSPSGNGNSTASIDPDAIRSEGRETERKRAVAINEAFELVSELNVDGVEQIAARGIADGDEAEVVQRAILKRVRECRGDSAGPAIHSRDNEKDCTRATLAAGLMLREGFQPDGKKIVGPLNDRGAFKDVKFTDELAERGERYVDMTVMDMARECLRLDGHEVPHGREELIRRAFSTHALANVLGATANKLLLKGYEENPGTALGWVGEREVADFKTVTETRLSEASDLKELNEAGEIEHGEIEDVAETYKILTFGRMYVFTRQDMINDDLGALNRWTQRMGAAANRLVDDRLYTVLLANGNLSDGTALFHADHGNFQTGAGSNLDDTSLDLARQEMREQTDLAGLARLNIIPKFLLGPPALEGLMKRLLQSTEIRRTLTGTTDIDSRETNANIWQNALMPIIEPRIAATGSGGMTGGSDTAYYVIANSNQANHLIAAFLRGFRRPTIERADPPNDTLGIGWRTYFDTEGAALDFRGIHKSDGA